MILMSFFDDFARNFEHFEAGFGSNASAPGASAPGASVPRGPVDNQGYYDILGVSKDADTKVINRAYRRMAIQHHPDKGGDKARFALLNEARDVLTDPDKRKLYDRFGKQGLTKHQGLSKRPGAPHMHRRQRRVEVRRNINVTLQDVFSGRELTLAIQHTVLCDPQGQELESIDSSAMKTCPRCNGCGFVVVIRRTIGFVQQSRQPCSACQGRGRRLNEGYTLKEVRAKVKVKIDPGMADGDRIVLKNKGGWRNNHMADLVLIIRVNKHPVFERKAADLVIRRNVSLFQALMGVRFNLTMPDGSEVQITSPADCVVHPGMLLRVPDLGMPIRDTLERGSLYCHLDVIFPETIPKAQREVLRNIIAGDTMPDPLGHEQQYCLERTDEMPGGTARAESSVHDDDSPRPPESRGVQCAQQ